MRVEDIPKLFETGKKIDLGKGIVLDIKKWGTDEAPILMNFGSLPKDEKGNLTVGKEFGEFMKQVITITLRRGITDATDADELEVPLDAAMKIFEAAMEVNKEAFGTEEDTSEFLEKIKKRQNVGHTPESGNKKGAKS